MDHDSNQSTGPDRHHHAHPDRDRDHDRNRDPQAERDRGERRSNKSHDRDAYRRSSRNHDDDDDRDRKASRKSSMKHKKERKSSKSSKKLKYKESSSSSSRHRHRHSSDSDSEGSASNDDTDQDFTWVEKTTADAIASAPQASAAPVPELTRDSWMTGGDDTNDALAGLFGGSRDDRRSTARAAAQERKHNAPEGDVHISTREINPYWKMGLKGLPPTMPSSSDAGNDSDSSVSSTVSHFTMRKMDRVVEIAKEEGRSIEEVGAERFGSKEAFQEAYAAYQSSRKPIRPPGASSLRIASSANDVTPSASSSHASALTNGLTPGADTLSAASTDDTMTLDEMVRRERLGIDDNMDRALMSRISRDARFKDDVDYMDEESDRLASTVPSKRKLQLGPASASSGSRRKVTSMEDLVRQHKALKDCQYCFRDGGRLPDLPTIVAVGIRAYLVIVPYRSVATCQIVPVEHLVSTLEGDDEFWDEVRNFKKCLMQMYAAQNLAVLFSETVLDPTHARHTHIDVIPVPPHIAADAPGYMRTALRTDAEAHDWTQHPAVIDTRMRINAHNQKVGGFRRCMVPNLPYVHVWYDLDGGHGHVIEERGRSMHDGFVREVIGGAMDVDPAMYRRQKWLPRQVNHDRVRDFVKRWEAYDWTKMLEGGDYGGAQARQSDAGVSD